MKHLGGVIAVFVPGTLGQVVALLVLVLPGFVFTGVKARLRGPSPSDGDTGRRVLTSIGIGAVLDAMYVVVGGTSVTRAFSVDERSADLRDHPRVAALIAFALIFAIPATLAVIDDFRERGKLDLRLGPHRKPKLRYAGRYDPIPTAWDFAGPPRGGNFVRVRQTDGSWVGGWFGAESFLSTWPEARDLFIESQWRMKSDGAFDEKLVGTQGVYVSCPEGVVVEWVAPPTNDGDPDEGEDDGGSDQPRS